MTGHRTLGSFHYGLLGYVSFPETLMHYTAAAPDRTKRSHGTT